MAKCSCSAVCAKYILFAFNGTVALVGLALLGIGIWFLSDSKAIDFIDVANDEGSKHLIKGAAVTLVVVGAFSFIVGILGCWGAIHEKITCLSCYIVILVLLMALEILAMILAGAFHDQVKDGLQGGMYKTLKEFGKSDAQTQAWNYLQYELSCCGVVDPLDWKYNSTWYDPTKKHHHPVPRTCCKLKKFAPKNDTSEAKDWNKCKTEAENFEHGTTGDANLHDKGCEVVFEDWIHDHLWLMIGVALAIVAVELAGVLLACLLKYKLSRGYEYV